jgi:hypothetical protein
MTATRGDDRQRGGIDRFTTFWTEHVTFLLFG